MNQSPIQEQEDGHQYEGLNPFEPIFGSKSWYFTDQWVIYTHTGVSF